MSYGISTLNPCENLQVQLNERWAMQDTARKMEPMPFFETILSERNMAGVALEVAPGRGKTRTVNARYDQRINEDNVLENQSNPNCVATTQRGDCLASYEIDTEENLQVSEVMNITDFEAACRDNQVILNRKFELMMDALVRKTATKTTEQAVLLTGAWGSDVTGVDANDNLEVETLRSGTTDQLSPFALEKIDMALMQSAYSGDVGIFGGSLLWEYARRISAGCCADQGVDLGAILDDYGKAFGYDPRVADALGGNEFNFAMQMGALQLIVFNLFDGPEGFNQITGGSDYQRRVIIDPRTGLPIDLVISDNCGAVSITMTATTKLISMPDDLFGTGDRYAGVKFFNTIEVVNT